MRDDYPEESYFKLFDHIEQIVYVCDIETNELVYSNKYSRERLNKQGCADYRGEKCYKYFQNLDAPCPFCNNKQLLKDKKCIWMHKNKVVNTTYLIHDTLLELNGRQYRLELAVDIDQMDTEMKYIKSRLQSEQLLGDCIRKLVRSESFDDAVNSVMETVLDYYDGDRAYIFEYNWDTETTDNTYEICAEGIQPEKDNLQHVPLSMLTVWNKGFFQKKTNVIENLEDLLQYPDRLDEYNVLKPQGITSLITVPFFKEDVLAGFLGVDNPKTNFEDTEFIENLIYFISNEIQKNHFVKELERMSLTDNLVGVNNRNAYELRLEKLKQCKFQSVGVVFIDMNGLKYINDNLGHQRGDKQLQLLGEVLLKYFPIEHVYRISGDEFVILMENLIYEAFDSVCVDLQRDLCETQEDLAAVGYVWGDKNSDIYELVHQAEQLMYADKQKYYLRYDGGRGVRPKYVDQVMETLKQDDYVVYLQPQYEVASDTVYGAEALVRRIDNDGRVVFPSEFIKALEKENLISFVDYLVFEKVCKTLKEWADRGYKPMRISSNFSRLTIAQPDFVERLLYIVYSTGVDPHQLVIEATESSNMVHVQKLTEIMQRLKYEGITFALDDVGTEYATLAMLELVELNTAKFDISLVKRVRKNTRTQLVLKKMIELCHELGMDCVAEGVETEEQLESVSEIGCDKIQGYLIGRPMPIDEFENLYLK